MGNGVKTWSTTAGSNVNSLTGINWDEGMNAAAVNNSARATMADIAAWYAQIKGGLITGTVGGTANAITLTCSPTVSALSANSYFLFKLASSITSTATLNVDSIGALALQYRQAALATGMYSAGDFLLCMYDGTQFQVLTTPRTITSTSDLNSLTTDSTGGDVADYVPFVDVSESNASNKVLVSNFMANALTTATADSSPASASDYLFHYDASATAFKKVLHQQVRPTESFTFALSDETTTITTGTAKLTWRMPYAFKVTSVRASVNTVSSSGLPTVDINEGGTTILSTKLTIDANEKTSTTAATAAVISDPDIADDAEITFDIDVAGTGAKGLKVTIIGYRV